jgi:hypothetical protein
VSASVAGPIEVGGAWAGDSDAAIVSFDGQGTRLWSQVIGTHGTDYGGAVASGRDGFYATIDMGEDIGATIEGVPIQGAPSPQGILLKIQP